MKQTNKNFIFTNFDSTLSNKKVNKSDLKIDSIYNLSTNSGIIKPLNSFSDLIKSFLGEENFSVYLQNNSQLSDNIIYATIYEYRLEGSSKKRLFVLDSNLYLYELNLNTYTFTTISINFDKLPRIFKQNGKLYFYCQDGNFVIIMDNYDPICLTASPKLLNYTDCAGMSYFTTVEDPFRLFYTEQIDIENLSDELDTYEFININKSYGDVLEILAYKNSVYVVQQYSISKIYLSTKDVYQQVSCSVKSKILPNTICLIDDYIIFLSSAGLFLFDSNDIRQIFETITNKLTDNNFFSEVFNNTYFLSGNIKFKDSQFNALIEINIENNFCNIYKIGKIENVYSIQTFNEYKLVVAIKEDNEYKIKYLDNIISSNTERYIKFSKISFDDYCLKILNKIKLNNDGNFKIKIKTEYDEISLDATQNFEINNLGLKGQLFDIEIFGNDAFSIDSIYFGISYVGE